jgi:putative copper export protein/mono/diheme cytochrome c family protein
VATIDIVASILRAVHLLALLSLFGTLVSIAVVAPPALAAGGAAGEAAHRRLVGLARGSAVLALASGMLWLGTATATIAGTDTLAATIAVLPTVALRTRFGQLLLLRLLLLLVALPLLRVRRFFLPVPLALVGIALALQAALGHAGAVGGSNGAGLLGSEFLHLLAAGAWLGGLPPLLVLTATLPPPAAAMALRRFSPLGVSAVLVLTGTALAQASAFIGGLPGLLGTAYGHIATLKLSLFLLLVMVAAVNRFVLTERLAGIRANARLLLLMALVCEVVAGASVVTAAAFLASSMPATHEQPVWPFAWRPSAAALADPAFRGGVVAALLACGGALALAVAGLAWRRMRWPALGVAAIILLVAVPQLWPLLIPAYPSSFFTSTTEFADSSIVRGGRLFERNCAICHGATGHGDGPQARSLPVPPADLTAEHLWSHSEGDLFWYLSHGIDRSEGGQSMPGFAGKLSSEARWQLIDFLRARNAGEGMRVAGKWLHPLPVPQFDADCADGRAINMDDLRGRVLRFVAAPTEGRTPAVTDAGVTTIILAGKQLIRPEGATCVANAPETWAAFAIIAGVKQDGLAGAQLLADGNGWLRLLWRPGEPGNRDDPAALAAMIRDIAAHPLPMGAGGVQGHRH